MQKLLYNLIPVLFRATLILLAMVAARSAVSGLESNASFYIDAYGLADPELTPQVERANSIFRQLKRTAGQSVGSSRLVVIASERAPWALSLADGNVILSAGALRIIYDRRNVQEADALLAFVLGHELAHLANRDLWHYQIFASMAGNSSAQLPDRVREVLERTSMQLDEIRKSELKADEVGFIYASLAGFQTSAVFGTNEQDSFLRQWVDQTRAWVDDEHHSPEVRTGFLEERLRNLHRQVELFNYGVRLSHFGRFEDALHFLNAFHHQYPSRQVLNNLGYVNIQLARKEMSPELAYRFWYPTMLETHSGVPERPRQWPSELSISAENYLMEAVELLTQALRLAPKDIVASMNLVVAHLYLGEYFKARAVVEEALSIRPSNVQLKMLRALILLDQESQIDMWQHVADELTALLDSSHPAPDNLLFNLARLHQERGRHGQATSYWQTLLKLLPQLPDNYRLVVCSETEFPSECDSLTSLTRKQTRNNKDWVENSVGLPLVLGANVDARDSRQALRDWQHSEWQVGPFNARVFSKEGLGSVLAINHHTELVVIRSETLPSPDELRQLHGAPTVTLPLNNGELWSYGSDWSAFLKDGQLSELWIARQ